MKSGIQAHYSFCLDSKSWARQCDCTPKVLTWLDGCNDPRLSDSDNNLHSLVVWFSRRDGLERRVTSLVQRSAYIVYHIPCLRTLWYCTNKSSGFVFSIDEQGFESRSISPYCIQYSRLQHIHGDLNLRQYTYCRICDSTWICSISDILKVACAQDVPH